MPDFYYQIKGKESNSEYGFGSRWSWPPIVSGKVTAENKKKARAAVEEEYERKLPMRVPKDDTSEPFLLHLTEFDEHHYRLFEELECEVCGNKFRRIDLYNDVNETYKGESYCSSKCKTEDYERRRNEKSTSIGRDTGVGIIYGIRNKRTGLWYVGKTKQVFTLRWYQHFYQSSDTPFHKEIKNSPITDWEFSILEQVSIEKHQSINEVLTEREKFWIGEKDSLNEGYNSANVL